MQKKLTLIVINFLREPYLWRCLESFRKQYGYDIEILVGENGKYTNEKKKRIEEEFKAKYIELPYDSGVCVARNRLMDHVNTPYILIGDDDFLFGNEARVDQMLEFLEYNDRFDLIGGRIREGGIIRNYQGFIEDHGNYLHYKKLEHENYLLCKKSKLLYRECDLTFNYFVARTEKIKEILWEEKIKVAYEHSLFFIRFKKAGNRIVFSPDPIVVHKPPVSGLENKEEYREFRARKNDKEVFFKEIGIDYAIDMNGRRDFFDRSNTTDVDFCITTFKRPEFLKRLLLSIAKYYPFAKIFIADQDRRFLKEDYLKLYNELYDAGLQQKPVAYNLFYDCGLSYARNYLMKITKSKYRLLLEDDFVFEDAYSVGRLVDVLEENDKIDCVGGKVYENGQRVEFECSFEKPQANILKLVSNKENPNIVMNFILFRGEVFKKVKWDQDLKHTEHIDFFLKFKDAGFKVKYCNDSNISHNKQYTEMTNELSLYKDLRKRDEFLKIMMRKNKLIKIIYPNGFTKKLVDGKIIEGRNL